MSSGPTTSRPLLTLALRHDQDVVTARQRAAHIASLLGYDQSEQTRIATAVSEIVRNAFRYSGGGDVAFGVDADATPQTFVIDVRDKGPGIPHLDDVLAGRYRSTTGLGIGISGSRRLVDTFDIASSSRGTAVTMRKFLPPRAGALTVHRLEQIREAVERRQPGTLVEEFQRQNQELLRALDELQRRGQELVHLNRELEDTNRGVVALYAELDEKAEHLRRADELKSRFLSNMTHEFRTPVNSIIGLCNLLTEDRVRDGREPEPEIFYIRKAADQLSELVNDLLDLAKVEAGKTAVRSTRFDVERLFRALRGMLRPLLLNQSVRLVFEDATAIPEIVTDEAKVSQILRNLISNALKFTERGEVRIAATLDNPNWIRFTVSDTGIGIAEEDQQRIFEEFAQVEHPLQRGVHGTGLGLPLSRRLAELLGGTISVQSTPGIGSRFAVELPTVYRPRPEPTPAEAPPVPAAEEPAGVGPAFAASVRGAPRVKVLVVEDEEVSRFVIRQCLPLPAFDIIEVATGEEALRVVRAETPDIILLDLNLPGMSGRSVLEEIRGNPATAAIPVLIVTGMAIEPSELAYLLQRAAGVLSKSQLSRETLAEAVRSVLSSSDASRLRPI